MGTPVRTRRAELLLPSVATLAFGGTMLLAACGSSSSSGARTDDEDGQISTPVAQPHPVEDDIEDLYALLNAANEPGPYVLVAHSYGGLIAELYSSAYPEDVVGRVYVDVTSVLLRETLSPDEYQALIESTGTPPEPGGEALEIRSAIESISDAAPAP